MANNNKEKILSAAQEVFIRHGFKKVTMNDIAEKAGISRPAIYLVFKNKTDIFKEFVIQIYDQAISEILDGLKEYDSVAEKLRFTFEAWFMRKARASVIYTHELSETFMKYAGEQQKAKLRQFEDILESIISPYTTILENRGITPGELAHLLVLSGFGIMQEKCSPEERSNLVDVLINLTLAGLGEDRN